jgi:hypothetical protein
MTAGLVMMIVTGLSSPTFSVWSSLFAIGLGGFLPEPKVKKDDDTTGVTRAAYERLRQVIAQ